MVIVHLDIAVRMHSVARLTWVGVWKKYRNITGALISIDDRSSGHLVFVLSTVTHWPSSLTQEFIRNVRLRSV